MALNYERRYPVKEPRTETAEINDTFLTNLFLQKKIQLEKGGENIDAILIKKLNPLLRQVTSIFIQRMFRFFEHRQIVILREELHQELLIYLLSPSFLGGYQPDNHIRTFLFQVCYRRLQSVFITPQKRLKRTPLDRALSLEEITHIDEDGVVVLEPEIADLEVPLRPLQDMEELQDKKIINELLLSLPDPTNAILIALYYGLGKKILQSVLEHFDQVLTNLHSKGRVTPTTVQNVYEFDKKIKKISNCLKTKSFKNLVAQSDIQGGVTGEVLGEVFEMTRQAVDFRIKKALEQLRQKKTLLETLNSRDL